MTHPTKSETTLPAGWLICTGCGGTGEEEGTFRVCDYCWGDGGYFEDDEEWAEDAEGGLCKYGGPAPCVDDICHGIGGCMGYAAEDHQP